MAKEKKKKKEVVKEPEYYLSKINTQVLNYKVYYMKPLEKLAYQLLAFVVGAAVGYLFYGGLGKDAYGNNTLLTYILNAIFMILAGSFAAKLFIPIRTDQIIEKRNRELKKQFRDMLDSLTTSIGAGRNINRSFEAVYDDLKVQYEEGSYILNELEVINAGIRNNINVEELLMDFGERSGNDDIKSFAKVFEIGFRKGADIKEMVRNTHSILSDKMEIGETIETTVSSSKLETYIMLVAPIVLTALIKIMSADMAENFASAAGFISTTIAIVLFVASYFIAKKVLDIKV